MSQIRAGIILSYLMIVVVNLSGLLSTPIIVKTLGSHQYGVYILVSSIVSYIFLIDLGVANTINRFIAKYRALKDKESEEKFLSMIFRIMSYIGIAVFLLAAILYYNVQFFLKSEIYDISFIKNIIVILAVNGILNLFNSFVDGYLLAYEKFIFSKVLFLIKTLFRLLFVLLFFSKIGSVIVLVSLDAVLSAISLLLSLIYFFRNYRGNLNLNFFDKELLKEIFSYSIWISIFTLVSQIQWQTGQIILGYKLNANAVALYGIGVLLGTYYGAFSSAVSSVFISRTTIHVHQNYDMQSLTDYMIKIGRICALALMLILINFAVVGRDFIELWLGKGYADSWVISLIFMIVYTIPLIQSIANQILEAKRKFYFKSLVYLICMIFGLVLGTILVTSYSILGMALGICIGWLIAIFIMNYYYHVKIGLNVYLFFRGLLNIFGTSIIVFIVSNYLIRYVVFLPYLDQLTWFGFLCKITIVSVIYMIFIYFMGLSNSEKSIINYCLRRKCE